MIKYQPKHSTELLYQLFGSFIFIIIALFLSRPTANNDIFVQLLAIDGILSNFDFSEMGHHPLGIAVTASLLKLCKLDPLICLYFLQPFLCGLCFWILYRLLKTVLPSKYAFFMTFSSLSSLVFIKSMNQVTAEIISLTTILLLMTYVWKIFIQNNKMTFIIVTNIVILSWIAILFRNAAIFIIIGILIFLFINNKFSKLSFFIVSTIMLLPGGVKTLFYYNQPVCTDNLFSISLPLKIITQFTKHFLNFTEVIFPYSLHLNRIPWLKLIIVICILLFLLFITRYKKDLEVENNKRKLLGDYFFIVGMSYYCILSFASVYYDSNWGELYRVSGFGILFILNGFWLYIFSYTIKWRKYILVILTISSICKISYGIRYELLSQKSRFNFQDYRQSVKSIIDYAEGRWDEVYVYLGEPWEDTNLLYMLQYYDIIYSLPFEVSQYNSNREETNSVIFCTEMDLNHFQSNKYKLNNISGLKTVYAVIY